MKVSSTLLVGLLCVGHVTADKLNPISRVVELLQGLAKKVETDGKAEEELFEAYFCWAKTVIKSKTASNAAAKDRIESLEAYIDDIESGRIEFSSERTDLEAQIEDLQDVVDLDRERGTRNSPLSLVIDALGGWSVGPRKPERPEPKEEARPNRPGKGKGKGKSKGDAAD